MALVGFSQGTMMALHAGLRRAHRRQRSSAIPASSCCPTEPRRTLLPRDIKAKPPVLLIHGD